MKFSDNPKLQQKIEDAWLGIDVDETQIYNPLANIPEELEDNPELYIIWLMSQPEYFSFICKEILNLTIYPFQALILRELWHRKFPMLIGSRGLSKTFLLAIYNLLRLLLLPGRKIVVAGAAFRQSKFVLDYMERIYRNAPILQSMLGPNDGPRHGTDMWSFVIGESIGYYIPIGDGSKIRGLRANDVIAEEFASIPVQTFETVISGFAAVASNPIGNAQLIASIKKAKELGEYKEVPEEMRFSSHVANQVIACGTASYDFSHFADYWKKWHDYVTCKGNYNKIAKYFSEGVDKSFDWRHYSIIRIPYELIPEGFMDDAQVARSRATMHTGTYEMEFGAVFSKDSKGFFKRSLIEQASITNDTDWSTMPIDAFKFEARLRGLANHSYVMGVDPAADEDNFAIVILEPHNLHRRIVYCWTTNSKQHKEELKSGKVKETDYYAYCCRKIRDLMKVFNIERIAIDKMGGGTAIIEGLHDKDKLSPGEEPLWPTIVAGEPQDSDGMAGKHIIDIIKFANADWTSEANNGLRKDLEDKALLFPFFDTITLGLMSVDESNKAVANPLEDCIVNIEELKDEMTNIILTQTVSGRDKWDTPEIKLPGNKKGRMRKDRYSALLMANSIARSIQREIKRAVYEPEGGFAQSSYDRGNIDGPMFVGPAWFVEKMKGVYD